MQNQVRQQHDQLPLGRQSESAPPLPQLQPQPLQLQHQQRHPITVPIVLRSQTLKTFTTNIIVNRYCLRPPTTTMHSLISPRNRQRHPQPSEPQPPPKSPPEQSVPSTMVSIIRKIRPPLPPQPPNIRAFFVPLPLLRQRVHSFLSTVFQRYLQPLLQPQQRNSHRRRQ